MPLVHVFTNVSKTDIKKDLPIIISKEFANMLGKPLSFVACSISADNLMAFGGTDAPCAMVSLMSIGKINKEKNREYSKRISELLNEHLGIKPDRYYLSCTDFEGSNIGHNGNVFG